MQPGGVILQTSQTPAVHIRTNALKSPGPVSSPTTPHDYISPSTRRHVTLTTPREDNSDQTNLTRPNDDEAERKERRRSRVLGQHLRHLASPATPADRQVSTSSAPLSGLSNVQLSEHYTNCIKLSTQNKITSKNAFGLHLIDYMAEQLKKKEITNFQVASSTLAASAQIYAGRVDAIHSETYKVLTGLGRGAEKNTESEDGDGEERDPDGSPRPKKRKKGKHNKIQTNLKKINIRKSKLAFEKDPLFNKTSFEEGGTASLLNHLQCLEEFNLEMDEHNEENTTSTACMRDLKHMFVDLKLDNTYICQEFSDFEFTNWAGGRDDGLSGTLREMSKKSSYAFDVDAEVETIPDSCESENDSPLNLPDDGFGNMDDDDDHEDAGSALGSGDRANLSGSSFTMGDNPDPVVQNTIRNMKHGLVGTLMQVLATEPSEYSYFNTDLLQTWAGPSHWKLRAKSKAPCGDAARKPRGKKEAFVASYDEEADLDKHFRETRASTTLTKATLNEYSKNQPTLPQDLHYSEGKIFKYSYAPRPFMTKRQKRRSSTAIDTQIENYNYDNANDKDNFCGDEGAPMDDDPGEFDFTEDASQLTQETLQDGGIDVPAGDGFGSDLVAQPRKVAKIDIGFAKTAKKMDVRRLKESMWGMLTVPQANPPDENLIKAKSPKKKKVPTATLR